MYGKPNKIFVNHTLETMLETRVFRRNWRSRSSVRFIKDGEMYFIVGGKLYITGQFL